MPQKSKMNNFQDEVTYILNDVAEVVLNWTLGKITNEEAMKKINRAFAKRKLY